VVGFYSFFSTTPRGRHTIRVCLGTACYVRGAKRVLEAFKQSLGVDVGRPRRTGSSPSKWRAASAPAGIAPACLVATPRSPEHQTDNVPTILHNTSRVIRISPSRLSSDRENHHPNVHLHHLCPAPAASRPDRRPSARPQECSANFGI